MKLWFKLLWIVAAVTLPGLAQALTIRWTAPTQREDDTALAATEIASYRIHLTLNGVALVTLTAPGTASSYQYNETVRGRYCATVVTVDTDGLESVPSTPPACRNANPKAPSGVGLR
jgi:hypothetical protein